MEDGGGRREEDGRGRREEEGHPVPPVEMEVP